MVSRARGAAGGNVSPFTTYDGTELSCTVLGAPGEPVIVLPGGPLLDSRYLGDLAGLDARRELVILHMPRRRVDRIVPDVEALREHLGRQTVDVVAHSAGANLATLYAAAHPDRIGKLVLITPSARAVTANGPSPDEQSAIYARCAHEPWYAQACAAADAWDAGTETPEQRQLAKALTYGRWDDAARAHAAWVPPADAQAVYYAAGALDPAATRPALAAVTADVLVLAGQADPMSPLRLCTELAGLFAHADVVVQPGAGHYPWLDDPEFFVATVGGFLSRA